MTRIFLLFCFWIIILLFSGFQTLLSQNNAYQWHVGEELIYKVTWSFIRLGTIKVRIADTTIINQQKVYKIEMNLDSNPYIFFVNIHNYYESFIDDQFRLIKHIANERIEDKALESLHLFNYQDSTYTIRINNPEDSTKNIEKNKAIETNMYDGITLAFFARAHAHEERLETVTTFVLDTSGLVDINFKGRGDEISIEAIPEDIPSYYVEGEIHVEGLAGLTGPYRGWFSVDDRRAPLKAELKVFIGNVKVELDDYKKWRPNLNN